MAKQGQQVRIIGGQWRGRKVNFPEVGGLRPTPDRVRETLFNWLQTQIQSAHCLDLFAGSGVLGFEALSRGAATATLVDQNKAVIQQLKASKALLTAENASIIQAAAPEVLSTLTQTYNIVFIDPPYQLELVTDCLRALAKKKRLSPDALIYIETNQQSSVALQADHYEVVREKTAGQVSYRLLRYLKAE